MINYGRVSIYEKITLCRTLRSSSHGSLRSLSSEIRSSETNKRQNYVFLLSTAECGIQPYDVYETFFRTGLYLSGASIKPKPSRVVRDLGVIVDGDLSLTAHVTSVCFFQRRQLRLIRRSLTVETAHVLVRALVHSRLDYCNTVIAGLPAN